VKNHGFASREVGSCYRQRDAQFLKGLDLEQAVEESNHALITGESVAGKGPAGNVLEAHARGDLLQLRRRKTAAVCGADKSAYACTCNISDRDIFFFENLEDADVGDAAGETSAQGQTNAGIAVIGLRGMPGKLAAKGLYGTNDLAQTLHGTPTL